jgi:hypothetical protein
MTSTISRTWKAGCGGLALLLLGSAPALSAAGDTHRVTAEAANLRAGPSNDAAVRGQLEQDAEVIELRSERGWLGVRVVETGEEGWIFGELVETVRRSGLAEENDDAGFRALSQDFDRIVQTLNAELGYRMVDAVDQTGEDELAVTLTPQWLRYGGRDAHMLAATSIYQMWKNHQDQRAVRLVVRDPEGEDYITIIEDETGPMLSVALPGDEPNEPG